MIAGLLFGFDKALYSIIYQYASTQMLHMLYKRYQKQTLFIVTNQADQVCKAINTVSMHGATILSGLMNTRREKWCIPLCPRRRAER